MTSAAAAIGANRLLIAATIAERRAMRYTPAGLPVCDLVLKHESTLAEAGQPRKVAVELRAVGIGEIASPLQALPLGAAALYGGFVAGARNGRGLVFHITTVEPA